MNTFLLIKFFSQSRIFLLFVFLLLVMYNILFIYDPYAKKVDSNAYTSDETLIFVITPTYTRPTQMPDMTRLAQTLMHIKNMLWIVVEDSTVKSLALVELLERSAIPFVHLLAARPKEHQNVYKDGRGVSNRLKALQWLRDTYSNTDQKGVIYFADDDNTYDIRLFQEIRRTQKVSIFPVGLIATLGLSAPILDNTTAKVIGWHDPCNGRKFAVDMAGFAVSLSLFLSRPDATMIFKAGLIEDYFLRSLRIQWTDLEPMAGNCTVIMVWHTRSTFKAFPLYNAIKKVKNYNQTNLPILYKNLKINVTLS